MAIFTGIGKKFMEELPLGLHKLAEGSPSDDIYVALYGPNATIAPTFDAYTTVGEISGGGYSAGGKILATGLTIVGAAGSSRADGAQFSNPYIQPTDDLDIPCAGIAVRGAMMYNSTVSDRNIFCLDFGQIVIPVTGISFSWDVDNIAIDGDQLIPLIGQMI